MVTESDIPGKKPSSIEEAKEAMRKRASGGDADAIIATEALDGLVDSAKLGQDLPGYADFIARLKEVGHELLREDDPTDAQSSE